MTLAILMISVGCFVPECADFFASLELLWKNLGGFGKYFEREGDRTQKINLVDAAGAVSATFAARLRGFFREKHSQLLGSIACAHRFCSMARA